MYLPTLPQRFAPDDGRVTDKQHDTRNDTRNDTQKTAGELQGRARRGQRGREGERAHGTAAPEHTTGAGEEDKRREGRQEGGTRMASRLGERSEQGGTAAGREQGENEKEIYKYLRERREKKRR